MAHLMYLFSLYLLLLLLPLAAATAPLESFIYGACSRRRYAPNSPFSTNLNSLLPSLVNSATYSAYNHMSVMSPAQSDVVYGLYQCRGDLSMPDCASCVAHAAAQTGAMCPSSTGAAVQLQGCYLKYDNDSFFGVEDKSVVFKKCGPSVEYDQGKSAARDAVLNGLAKGSSTGPYRVGGSKEVQGMAQCVGDLSGGQCQDCVGEAVNQLKSLCGSAGFGDMFLGKCYARFSASGLVGGYTKPGGGSGGFAKSMGVKLFAIIVGLLAGVVILVIFLTFLCRTFAGSGK